MGYRVVVLRVGVFVGFERVEVGVMVRVSVDVGGLEMVR